METKDINKKQELLIFTSGTILNDEWGKEQVVMSLQKAKEILQSFKVLGLKKGQECLIFKDDNYNEFRQAGEQHISYFISNKKEDTSKQGLGSLAIKDNGSEKGIAGVGFRERAEIQAQENIPSNQDSMQLNEDIGEN